MENPAAIQTDREDGIAGRFIAAHTKGIVVEFFVDDTEVDAADVLGGTIEEALRKVQSDLTAPGTLVVSLRCDGRDVPEGDMTLALSKPVSEFRRLEVFTATKGTLIAEAMEQASSTLDATSEECQRIAELLSEGKTTEGIQALGQCLCLWQQVHEAIGKSIQMLELDASATTVEGRPLIEMIERPRDLLLEIKQALTAKDHVLLADIMQFEFEDVAATWKAIVETLRSEAADVDE